MTSAKDLIAAKYKPSTRTVPVLLDGELADALDQAEAAVKAARRADATNPAGLVSALPALEAHLNGLRNEAKAAVTTFVLTQIPGEDFDAMKNAHPPTEAQWERYREQARAVPMFAYSAPQYDPDGLAPLLIAAAVKTIDGEPAEWGIEDGEHFWHTCHDGARADLLEAAYELNQKRTAAAPLFGNATAGTSTGGPASTTHASMESPTLSTPGE